MSKHEHKHGLSHDLALITARNISRRKLLGWSLGAGLVTLVGCPKDGGLSGAVGTAAGSGGSSAGSSAGGSCTRIPEETGGPYPADGSNGVNALSMSGIVRRDIRSSFGSAGGVAEGVPLTVVLQLVDAADGCSPAPGCAVYLWHCDRAGNYSLYSSTIQGENYLRGVQESDDSGQITLRSSKLAYAVAGYESSVRNLQQTTLASDNVFSDGWTSQTPSMSGDVSLGFRAELTVAVPISG